MKNISKAETLSTRYRLNKVNNLNLYSGLGVNKSFSVTYQSFFHFFQDNGLL